MNIPFFLKSFRNEIGQFHHDSELGFREVRESFCLGWNVGEKFIFPPI